MIRFSWRKGKSIGFIAFSDGTLEAYVYVCVPIPMACRDFVEILKSAKSTMKPNINTNKNILRMYVTNGKICTHAPIHSHTFALNAKCGFWKFPNAFKKLVSFDVDYPLQTGSDSICFCAFFSWVSKLQNSFAMALRMPFSRGIHFTMLKTNLTFSESENRIIEKAEDEGKTFTMKLRWWDATKGREQKGNRHSFFFYQGILFGFVLILQRHFRYFSEMYCVFLRNGMRRNVIIGGKGLTIVTVIYFCSIVYVFLLAIIVSIWTVVASLFPLKLNGCPMNDVVFTKQLNLANAYGWIASASASAKVTQKLLFIAFHISQEFYSIRTDNVQNSLMLKCVFLHATSFIRAMNFFLIRSMCFLTQPSIACPLQWNRNNIRLNRFSCVHSFSLWCCLSLNLIINI